MILKQTSNNCSNCEENEPSREEALDRYTENGLKNKMDSEEIPKCKAECKEAMEKEGGKIDDNGKSGRRSVRSYGDNNLLDCEWINGIAYGYGVLTFHNKPNCEKLECFWDKRANGLGTLTFKNGDVLKINYANGQKHGKGTMLRNTDGNEKVVYYIKDELVNKSEWEKRFFNYTIPLDFSKDRKIA